MTHGRLETLSNVVIAVVVAIMVLQLAPPRGAMIEDLFPLWPGFAVLQAAITVSGRALWANVLFLFGLSLLPFGTAWIGVTAFASIPMAVYGLVLVVCAFASLFVVRSIDAAPGSTDALASALGHDIKDFIWPLFYAIAIPMVLIAPLVAFGLYGLVAATWIVPGARSSFRSHL